MSTEHLFGARAFLGAKFNAGVEWDRRSSPLGKWVASGTHLFNAATCADHKELAIPSSLVAFSKDSKNLYCFDWLNRVIGVMDVEPR